MVEFREVKDEKTGEKSLEIDKRTLPKINNPPNYPLKYCLSGS